MTDANQIDCGFYWPWAGIINIYDNGIINDYSYVENTPGIAGGGMRLRQTINGKWDSDWFYKYSDTRGVLEYEDDYPAKWYQRLLYPDGIYRAVMAPGREIIWGGKQHIGETIERSCEIVGPFGQYGWQRVQFVDLLPFADVKAGRFQKVLVLDYWQSWSSSPDTKGARMYLAPGVGQIKTKWTINREFTGFSMELQETQRKGQP